MMEPAGEGQVQSVSQIATQLVSKTIKSFRESLTQVSEISAFWDDCLRYADAQAKMPEESVKKLAASVWQEGQAWVASITPEIECRLKTLPNRLSPAHHKKALETLQATFQMRSPITSGALSKQLKSFQKANPQKSAKQRMS
ncbi:hypothetical protein [Prosthecobacter debontii]|nr:hypothetical protein [Prosthecobacter debontii]